MQAPVLHAGMPPMTPAQGLMPHMAAHVPILPRMPSGHLGLARGAAFSPEEIAIAKKTGREEERGVNDGADVLLRAAKKARSEVQPPLRREEPPFHVAIPARAPRGAYEPEEVARESGYIGVRWSRKKGKWRVRIKANGKDNHVGFFPDAVAAAMHYDNAAKRFFPQWRSDSSIRLNFPDDDAAPSSSSASAAACSADARAEPSSHPASSSAGINAILAASGGADAVVSAPPSSRSVGVSTAPPSAGGKAVAVSPSPRNASSEPGLPTVLKPLWIPAESGKSKEKMSLDKSSLEHLLDDKTALVRTPSPQDAATRPASTGLGGTASSISTPATLPSPSTLWSPSVSRCQSTSRGPYTDTPPTIAGPPRLSAVACNTAGFVAPAVCVPGQHSATKKEGCDTAAGREEAHMELEALRGLVELARDHAPAVDFAIAHHKKVTARPSRAAEAGSEAGAGKKRDAASKKARERGRAVRAALTEAAEADDDDDDKQGGSIAPAPEAQPEGKRARAAPAAPAVPRRGLGPVRADGGYERVESMHRKSQNYRGVTWDKVKQMWRVRLCLAGGGREHIGYFSDEHEGALAYARALQRLKNELPAVRQEGGAAGPGALGAGGEEAAQRGAFSQVGTDGGRELCIPPMHPSEAGAGAGAGIVSPRTGSGGGFQAVPAQASAT